MTRRPSFACRWCLKNYRGATGHLAGSTGLAQLPRGAMMPATPKSWTIDALDPFDPSGCSVIALRLSYAHTDGLRMRRLDARYARIMLIPEVVRHPTIVLKGWKRDGYDEALIYVGRPAKDFRSPTIEVPPPPNKVFMVFVTPLGRQISDWRWEVADVSDPNIPTGMLERCERVLWPTNPQS